MAIYDGGLTDKQKANLELLTKQAAKYKERIDILKKKIRVNQTMAYDEHKNVKSALEDLEDKYKTCTAEIDYILNVQDEYKDLLRKSKMFLERAQMLQDTWNLDPNKIVM